MLHEFKLLYLLHFSLSDGLGLKAGVGPAQASVPPGPFGDLARRLGKAVEEVHLLGQAEGGLVGLVQDRLLVVSFHPGARGLSLSLLFLDCGARLGGGLGAEGVSGHVSGYVMGVRLEISTLYKNYAFRTGEVYDLDTEINS